MVSAHEYEKFKETFDRHECVPRSGLYLADGYDIVHSYTDGLEIKEEKEERQRGILILYALPDTCKLGLTEAQTYAVVWKTFQEIQQAAPHAVVFYGQETGIKNRNMNRYLNGTILPTAVKICKRLWKVFVRI